MRSSAITLGNSMQFAGILTLIVLAVIYVQFQARNILSGPLISLSGSYEPLQHERTIILEGFTRNIVKLTLNGKEIHTNEHGDFSQTLVLENGYTIMEINAQDRFGRTTTLERAYVYVPLPT